MPQARRRGSDTNQSRDKWQGWGALACTNSSSPGPLARGSGEEGREHKCGGPGVAGTKVCNERFIFGSLQVRLAAAGGHGAPPHAWQ